MTATTETFRWYRWTISKNEDGNFDVIDQDGNIADEATTEQDAIEACTEGGTDAYRQRLWDAITEADPDSIDLDELEKITRILDLEFECEDD